MKVVETVAKMVAMMVVAKADNWESLKVGTKAGEMVATKVEKRAEKKVDLMDVSSVDPKVV